MNIAALVGAGALLAGGLTSGPEGFVLAVVPVLVGLAAITAAMAVPTVGRRSRARWLGAVAMGVDGALRAFARPSWRLLGAAAYLGLDIAALGATMAATGTPDPGGAAGAGVPDRLPREPDPDPRRVRSAGGRPRRER